MGDSLDELAIATCNWDNFAFCYVSLTNGMETTRCKKRCPKNKER